MENKTVDVSTAKILGGLGYVFILLLLMPYVGWLLSLAGLVMAVIAINQISKALNTPDIFKNYIIALIVQILGVVIAVIFGFGIFVSVGAFSGFKEEGFIAGLGVGLVIFLLVSYILGIASNFLFYKVFSTLGNRINVSLFKIGGLLLFIGAILVIAFGFGIILYLIAYILIAIGFFSMPSQLSLEEG